jgi:hypothetical protein
MEMFLNRKTGGRSLRSVMKSIASIGAISSLMVAGLAFVAVAPASAATPATLAFANVPTTATAGSVLATFTVTVQDAGSTPAPVTTTPGAVDTIQITSSCILAGTQTETAVGGVATFNALIIDTGTSCTLTARDTLSPDTSLASITSGAITVSPGSATKIGFTTAPPSTATTATVLPTVRVADEDQFGNVVTGASDTITLTDQNCALTGGGATATTAGVASFSAVYISGNTTCVVTAASTNFPSITANVGVAANAASKLGFTSVPTTATAGSVLTPFVVNVEESNGVAFTSIAPQSIQLTSSCTLLGATTAVTASGVATFSGVEIKNLGACLLVATDVTSALTAATSSAVTVYPGTPTHLVFTVAPPTLVTTVGSVLPTFVVALEDVYGNVVNSGTGSTDVISLTSNCTLGGITIMPAVTGAATFIGVDINSSGTCVITATDSSRAIITTTATTSVGTPQSALVVSTIKGSLGSALQLSTTGGSGTGAVTYTVTNGTATGCTISGSTLRVSKVGTCLVTATKAAAAPYIVVSSSATTVTFVLPFKATKVSRVLVGTSQNVTITGSGFVGRPRVISNVAGLTATVSRDSGRVLTLRVTVKAGTAKGVRVFTIILGNGKRTSVRFNLS